MIKDNDSSELVQELQKATIVTGTLGKKVDDLKKFGEESRKRINRAIAIATIFVILILGFVFRIQQVTSCDALKGFGNDQQALWGPSLDAAEKNPATPEDQKPLIKSFRAIIAREVNRDCSFI